MNQLGLCGSIGVPTGSNWVKCGSYVGHVGHLGHVMRVKWVTWVSWATGQVKLCKRLLGAPGFHQEVFWATGQINGCLGL